MNDMIDMVDMAAVRVAAPLKAVYYPFGRAETLRAAVKACLTDYYAKASVGTKFEARGVLVTGKSRAGKTRELMHLIQKINDAQIMMPSGLPARIVNCSLPARLNWKELGLKTLMALGYPGEGRRTTNAIWQMVRDQAKRQGVIGIHYDEAQHMFSDTGNAANRVVLDSFKAVMKEADWPLILILSGVPSLKTHIETDHASEERKQLRFLLTPVHFELIRPKVQEDIEELNTLAYTYADKAGIDFDPLSNVDFFERLSHAGAYRWGLVIEMMIEAFTICRAAGETKISVDHFSEAFSRIHGIPSGYSPFTVDDYLESFDPENLLSLLDHAD
ncbi:AAA family ATPase [Falsirhodobacter deserti]|uniref:AAA family ATPase n=1 Tax=Falsirhodobacter deserti TaxID=1365611 RepID=UPI0019D475B2|nr:AAA family ATPase [Falsirhodobacter deserti]